MNNKSKNILVVAAGLVVLGIVLLGTAWFLGARPVQFLQNDAPGIFSWIRNPVTAGTHGGYRDWQNAYAADGQYAASVQGVDSVDLDWIAGDVRVQTYDGGEITFSETAVVGIGADKALRWGIEDGTLYIQYCPPQTAGDLPVKSLTLLLPAALAEKLDSFSFSGTSSQLEATGLTARSLSAAGVSGALTFADADAQRVTLSSVSGTMGFSGGFTQLDASSTSGDVVIDTAESGSVSVSTVTGRVTVRGFISDVTANTTSGNVELDTDPCPGRVKIGTVSGSVRLTLPSDCGFTLDFDTVSGGLDCGFPVVMGDGKYTCGDGAAELIVDTTSGSLHISA